MTSLHISASGSLLFLGILLAGCGGGGSSPGTPGDGATPAEATRSAIQRAETGSAVRVRLAGLLQSQVRLVQVQPSGLSLSGLSGLLTGPGPAGPQTFTAEAGNVWQLTTNANRSGEFGVALQAGGSLGGHWGTPQIGLSGVTIPLSVTVTSAGTPAQTLSLTGQAGINTNGTLTNYSDDALQLTGSLEGQVVDPTAGTLDVTGNLTLNASSAAGVTYHVVTTAQGGGYTLTSTEDAAINAGGTGTRTVTTVVTTPQGQVTIATTAKSDGTATMTITDQAAHVVITLHFLADPSATGTAMVAGQQAATITIAANGQGTITYPGGTETVDFSDLQAAATMTGVE